jgi:DNA invertase Pin-like site-specific DNA recombinase
MTKALAYMRCSGKGQIDGDTWDRQQEAITRYCTTNGIEVVEWYRDEGLSGKTELENRPGLAACLERVESNGVRLVIVESADRLARDSLVAELIVREFQKTGTTVISASGGVNLTEGDDSNPTAKLIRQILAAVAEFDRCVVVLKLRAARQRIRAKTGKCEGRKEYGAHADEARNLFRMRALRLAGMTYRQIADQLNSQHVTAREGGLWTAQTVGKILIRENSDSPLRSDFQKNENAAMDSTTKE